METCPVCETPHPRGALECPTCGKVFAAAEAAIAAARLPELEPTALVAANIAVPADPTPGLEVTAFAAVAAPVAAEVVPGLETTRQPVPAGAIALEAVPDLERTVQDPVGGPPTPRVVFCRGCGATGQAQGVFCDRCGMRLSRPAPEGEASVPGTVVRGEEATICRACGCRVIVDGVCTDCGVPA